MPPRPSLAQTPVGEMLESLAGGDPPPRGQVAAALSCAVAASLVEAVAAADESVLADARLARCSALRERFLELAQRDEGASTSLAIASSAAQLTSLAAECMTGASDAAVTDAIVAAELADGACRAAVHTVRISLRDVPGDPRRTEATSLVSTSSDALQEAFATAAERAAPA